MKKRLVTIPLLGLFIGFNYYWYSHRLEISVLKQIFLVCASITTYVFGSAIEVSLQKDKKKRKQYFNFFVRGLLLYYLFFIGTVVFFDGFFFNRSWGAQTNIKLFDSINLFFKMATQGNTLKALGNLVGNAILFAPMGILLPLVHPVFKKWSVFIVTILILVSSVEYTQYRLARGSADVDDIVLNFIGAMITYSFMKLFLHQFEDKIKNYFE